jgi:predicted DNA-binding protein with PD1-like motif
LKYTRLGIGELFIARVDEGETLPVSLIKFAEELKARIMVFYGIGGFRYAKIGFYRKQGEYSAIEISAPRGSVLEVSSIIGSVIWTGEKYHVHSHVTIGNSLNSELSARAISGHLLEAVVDPLLEVFAQVYSGPSTVELREVLPYRFNP